MGVTEEAASSTINNQGAIYFTKPENETGSFNAYGDTPLVIINKKLGYKIYFQLQEFYFNESTGNTSYYGFTRYEELGNKNRWVKNRRKAYYGSTQHFFRALINDRLEQESYQIFAVRTDTIKQANGTIKKMEMAIPVTAAQIVKPDSTDKDKYIVSGKNKIMVQYNRDPASKAYLKQHVFLSNSLPRGFRSYLILNNGQFEIDRNGILTDPLIVYFSGYWIYEKAANLLPYDYDPDTKK